MPWRRDVDEILVLIPHLESIRGPVRLRDRLMHILSDYRWERWVRWTGKQVCVNLSYWIPKTGIRIDVRIRRKPLQEELTPTQPTCCMLMITSSFHCFYPDGFFLLQDKNKTVMYGNVQLTHIIESKLRPYFPGL